MGQKFTYTQLVFGSIAFKLFNLGKTFRIAFHKLPKIGWVNFGPFFLTELMYLSQVCRPPCSHALFQFCHKFSIGLRTGLCGHSDTLTLLSLSHFATTLEVCLGSMSIWKTHLRALTSWLMSWDVASIYPHNFPSSWCYLFCEVHQSSCSKAPPHVAATPVLHGWDGVLRLASLPLFPPNITMVIMANQLYFFFIRPEDISPKNTIFVP